MSEHKNQGRDFFEIDMVEVFKEIGRQKKIIFSMVFGFTLLAMVIALTSKDIWTSTARIIKPSLSDLGDGVPISGSLAFSAERVKLGSVRYTPLQGDTPLPDFVFNQFYMYLRTDEARYSLDGKEELFRFSNMRIVKIDDVVDVQMRSETKEGAEAALKNFFRNVNSKFMAQYLRDALVVVKEEIRRTELSLQSEKELMASALKLAKKARIQEPKNAQIEGHPVMAYALLGENVLSAALSTIEESRDVFAGTRLKKLKTELKVLEAIQADGVQGQAFTIQLGKNEPALKTNSKFLNVIAFGIAAGLVCGILLSIGSLVYRRYKTF